MTRIPHTFVDLSTGHRRRISRRTLLTNFGTAGVGLTILGACGGSSGTGTTPTTQQASGTTPRGSDPVVTASTAVTDGETVDAPVGTATPSAPVDNAVGATDAGLQLQHVSLGFVSAYVLLRGNEAAIVDTGTSDSRDAILEGMAMLSVTPSMVRHIVLTHNHGDHAGGLSGLEADLANATVYVGAEDIGAIRSALTLAELRDGDEVFGMGVIATPGHTPGSISLFDTASGILVAGDAINGDGTGGLTGANPDFTADVETAAVSVEKLAALMPTVAAFGHGGPPVTDGVSAKLAAL